MKKTIKLVHVIGYYRSVKYTYRLRKKFLGLTIQKQGVYLRGSYYGSDAPFNHTLIRGVVYENPEVVITYTDKSVKIEKFEGIEMARIRARQLSRE